MHALKCKLTGVSSAQHNFENHLSVKQMTKVNENVIYGRSI